MTRIEALTPLKIKRPSGDIQLVPGTPVEFSDDEARRLLAKAPGKVRVVDLVDWLALWRALAQDTDGLLPDDPRVSPILSALAACEGHHKAGNLDGFQEAAARVRRLMQFTPGATVRWEGTVNHRLTVLGPATIEHVHEDHGRLYVWVTWQDTERWVSESIITHIEEPNP